MKKPLFIFGAGDLGRELASLATALPEWSVKGFYDDHKPAGTKVSGVNVIGGINDLLRRKKTIHLILAIGNPQIKKKLANRLKYARVKFPTLIHPSAVLQDRKTIDLADGAVIAAGCLLTTSITIGAHALLNLGVTVGHDTVVGAYASVMPGVNLAGGVVVGKEVLIGSGVNVINHVRLGDRCIVGAGAVVIRDTPAGTTSVGVPAAVIRK